MMLLGSVWEFSPTVRTRVGEGAILPMDIVWLGRRQRGSGSLVPTIALLIAILLGVLSSTGWAQVDSDSTKTDGPIGTPDLAARPTRPKMELSLPDAIRLALGHNVDLKIERLTAERSKRDRIIADAAFDPLFRTSYTMARFRQPSVSFLDFGEATSTITVNPFENDSFDLGISGLLSTGTSYSITAQTNRSDNPDSTLFSFNPRYSSGVRIQLTQPLLRGLGEEAVLADVRIAARNAEISSLELERRVEDILVVVANAYWDLLYARKDLEVKEQGLLEATDLLDINRRKLQVGSGTEIDVIDAEANIETQKAGIIDARNALDNAQDSLLDQINAPDYRLGRDNPLFIDVEIVPTTEPAFEDLELSLADSVDTALDERVELRQSRLTIENAEDLYDRASNDLLPSLDLIGSWTNSGLEDGFSGTWRELSGGTYYDWSVGLVFEIPIGNRAARERRSQADIDRSSAQLDRERTVNSIVLGVTQAVRNVRSAQQRVLTTRAATRLRSEQLDSEKRRLERGLSTSYQVLQTQNDLLEAQTTEVESVVLLLKAITAYRKQTGEVLGIFGIELN